MRLNMTTDYAIRLILCLAQKGEVTAGSVIAREMEIPPKYINKISLKLRAAKLIGSAPGSQGGYYLMKPFEKITLLEVLEAMDPSLRFIRYRQHERLDRLREVEGSFIHLYYQEMLDEIEKKWLSRNLLEIQERVERSERTWADVENIDPCGRTPMRGGRLSAEKEENNRIDRCRGNGIADRRVCHISPEQKWQPE